MPSAKCTLKNCAYINKRGYCSRKAIVLQVNREGLNELYCLGWSTPETRLFVDMCNERSPALPETQQK